MLFIGIMLMGVGVACLLWLRRGRKVVGIEPQCAACGYIVHGLPAPKCPECGADLSMPRAIVTTGRRRPWRLERSIGWSIFCVLAILIPVAFVWGGFVMPVMPRVQNANEQVTLMQPVSKGYRSIGVIVPTHGWVWLKQVPLLVGATVWGVGLVWIMLKPSKARGDSRMIR